MSAPCASRKSCMTGRIIRETISIILMYSTLWDVLAISKWKSVLRLAKVRIFFLPSVHCSNSSRSRTISSSVAFSAARRAASTSMPLRNCMISSKSILEVSVAGTKKFR